MIETLVPVSLPPGLYRNGTKLDASGRWYDGNLMRWVEGRPQPVGGWREAQNESGGPLLFGTTSAVRANSAIAWRLNAGDARFAFGSNERLLLVSGEIQGATLAGNPIPSPALVTGAADSVMTGATYGAGAYGAGPYGDGSGALSLVEAASWQLDTFGETLVAVLSTDGRLFSWDGSQVSFPAVTGAPTDNIGVVVTPERFLVALGADGDTRKVQWADQETMTTWTPTADNQAGDFILSTAGRIRCGTRTKSQTLIWTDVDLHSMNYIGGSLVYSFQQEGVNCGIISPHAFAGTDTQMFWMGRNGFYLFDGFVRQLPCDVRDYVFEDMNGLQAMKFWAKTTAAFGEVTWHYCSRSSTDIDRYVTYNYLTNHWTFGESDRTCGVDAGVYTNPIMIGSDRRIYEHEIGEDREGATPYLESGPVTLDKDRVMRIQRIVPDVSALGDANLKIYTSMYPTESETLNGPYSLANPTDVRLTAKHIRLRIEEATETSWRVGTTQLGVIPLGRR